MRFLKVLSLLAALTLLSGAVLDAQTGLVRQLVGAAPDGGRAEELYVPATKSAPVFRPQQKPVAEKDAGR